MLFENVVISGLAHVDAPHRVTSASLGAHLAPLLDRWKLPQNLVESMTGIVARRFWDPGTRIADAAAEAGRKALDAAGRDPHEIGLVISTSVGKDFIEPSMASAVHQRLGLGDAMNFDVSNACLSNLDAIVNAGNMIERGQIGHALIVCGESSRHVVDATIARLLANPPELSAFFRQFATLTLGSGAIALVLSHRQHAPHGHRVKGGVFSAASRHNHLCRGQPEEMQTDSSALLVAGLELAERTFEKAAKTLGWQRDSLDAYCIHQVSQGHTEKLVAKLGLSPQKVPAIYPEHGNMGPASWPTVLSKSVESGRIRPGDRVGILGIGSGLNCAMFEVEW